MNYLSPRYRRRRTPLQRREFLAAQARRIAKRWARKQAARAGEPVRKDRVTEITIRDTHRPQMVLRLRARPTRLGWTRRTVEENGATVPGRFGLVAIAKLLARVIL